MSKISSSIKQNIQINNIYLNKANYHEIKQNNKKLNELYEKLCDIFISHFHTLNTI